MTQRDLTDSLAQRFAGGGHLLKASEVALPEVERRGAHLAAGQAEHRRRATAETDRIVIAPRPSLIDRDTRIAMYFCAVAGVALILVCSNVPYQLGRLWGSL